VVDLGKLPRERLRVALHEAARHDELLAPAAPLLLRELDDRVHRLDLGALDEPAGVHDHDLGLRRILDEPVARLGERPEHHLAVDAVLRAAERVDVDAGRHRGAGI
jgi:hypothetical protein